MTPMTINNEGQCLCHPFVQLLHQSSRMGDWKALLDGCPLCVMDRKSTLQHSKEEKDGENQFIINVSNAIAT
jgi:hypothetical protein